ncbi:MAG: PleD family two-component system response regulator [Caulobacterales bacterium]|nr:PleD family two-component system response regulator [Caulobacterales bacterium]
MDESTNKSRILIADDNEQNVELLDAYLIGLDVETQIAVDGQDTLDKVASFQPDLILLDVMMPNLDGFETCRRLKDDPATAHIPVVIVTALDSQQDRVTGLEAGADEFLTKPIDDLALFARVRSLLRLKTVMDELRRRQESGRALGAIETAHGDPDFWRGGRILIVGDAGRPIERLARRLSNDHHPSVEGDPRIAAQLAKSEWDLVIVDLAAETFDAMRLAARLRSDEETRDLPIIAIANHLNRERMVRALDIGVNDVLYAPVDHQELGARVRTQIRRKRYGDYLRASLDESLELAVTDQLTGLNNRRFMVTQLNKQLAAAERGSEEPLSVMICDLDHFKRINDTHGHDAGDAVLKQFAARLAANVRAIDIACRYGGEEFVVVMPGADDYAARVAGDRLRLAVCDTPFELPGQSGELNVSVSVGVALLEPGETAESLLKRADGALYDAKAGGRNRVVVARDDRQAA